MLSGLRQLPKPAPRCLTVGPLPNFIDPRQPPQKRKPFGLVLQQECIQSIDLIFPTNHADVVKKEIENLGNRGTTKYAKVILSLSDILEETFLSGYIKTGTVMLISEGRRGVDNRFELFEGVLRIELDKPTYERAGLVGKPMSDGGQKHKHNRFAIEINLRQPSMLHGKKGFERVVWAAKNVLNQSMSCLFFDWSSDTAKDATTPLDRLHPRWFTVRPTEFKHTNSQIPQLVLNPSVDSSKKILEDKHLAADVEEWLSLIALQSPRVESNNSPDPFICRYRHPSIDNSSEENGLHAKDNIDDITRVSWRGFMPSAFSLQILHTVTKSMKGDAWWSMTTSGLRHDGDSLTILRTAGDKNQNSLYYCWHSIK